MAVLRGDIPVSEETIMTPGLLYERVNHRYTLLHLNSVTHANSRRADLGFSTHLESQNDEVVRLTIGPNPNRPWDQPRWEIIVRSVATPALTTTTKRFILPNDPELEEEHFTFGELDTREVACGVVPNSPATSSISFNPELGRMQSNEDKLFYVRTVFWVPDDHDLVAASLSFDDDWSE